jgi:hypothetical protein
MDSVPEDEVSSSGSAERDDQFQEEQVGGEVEKALDGEEESPNKHKDTTVFRLKILAFVVLTVAAAALGAATYLTTRNEEDNNFEDQVSHVPETLRRSLFCKHLTRLTST